MGVLQFLNNRGVSVLHARGEDTPPDRNLAQKNASEADSVNRAKLALADQKRIPVYNRSNALESNSQLRSDLRLKSYDQRGIDQLRTDALRSPGQQSAWGNIATQQQAQEQQNALNQGATQGASAIANARSGLAMGGGLRGGAGSRLALQGANKNALNLQSVRQQGIQNRLGISLQDEENRRKDLSGLAAQEAAYQAPEQQNIANTLGVLNQDTMGRNAFSLGKYGLSNEAYSKLIQGKAAEKVAANDGKG